MHRFFMSNWINVLSLFVEMSTADLLDEYYGFARL